MLRMQIHMYSLIELVYALTGSTALPNRPRNVDHAAVERLLTEVMVH